MKVIAIVQARMGSTRLPGKVMADVGGRPMIELLLSRLSRAQGVDQVVLATTDAPSDSPMADHVGKLGYGVYRGSVDDVLDRFYQAALAAEADIAIRITGDCPLVDPEIVASVITAFRSSEVDYASNVAPPTYPDGLDVEVFSFAALERAWHETVPGYDREHVTPYLRESGKFRTTNVANETDLSGLRWTVDEPADLKVVRAVAAAFAPRTDFTWREVELLMTRSPKLFAENQQIRRNEGASMGTGQKLWKRAKQIIPGGSMLLSKRAEMFLPDQWPAYFSRAKGCTVWDLDDNAYTDVSIMGIGTNTLGYGHPEVDAVAAKVVADGNMSTFNCPEEVYLAEKLIELHPWADMARFARSGGEINAVAIRIARAAAGREKVAFCGYHGWHDWYLAANLGNNKTLAGHLLPGLDPNGVPQELNGSILPFNYNRFDELEALVRDHEIGVIMMEVSRNTGPEDNFLENVRKLATDKGIVLIFDECTSGFRETFGGLHKKYGVEPDMAVFGKALGNGYAITAVIGRREVMEAAQSTFISSTFWTERLGPAAAVKTLEVMERERSWETITATGHDIRKRWQSLADKHGIAIDHWGLPALCGFTVKSDRALAYKTLITQEMLAKGYLGGNSVYVCTEHTPVVLDGFFEQLDPVFGLIRECEDGRDVASLLKGPVAHAGFKRLN
ncbi:MAG: aminotransferase class III-fold pyridoxal phosphate-dependent enzyme [Cypionkella sp.]